MISLPVLSTPVDFAYAVHTEVGHGCIGARVNGRLVPLETKLNAGDTVEILTATSEAPGPSEEWANFVVSPKAKSKIKQWFSRERNEDLVESGRDDLVEELRALGLPVARVLGSAMFTAEIESMNYQDEMTLYRAIGEGHVEASALAGRLMRAINDGGLAEQLSVVPRLQHGDVSATSRGVRVEGLDDVFVDLAKCCTPVPGDDIVGFLADGRSVDVHRADCARAA